MGSTGPLDSTYSNLTGGLVKPVKLFKKLGVAVATGLLALGIVAGTAAAAQANSSDIGSHDSSSAEFLSLAGNSSDIG
ncbi:hypothetical protein O1R50_13495 [Glycomyces luteolus]|uniref:Uncharacterized protein n=1 Tax=Glycomyces luteolus TaxID=2670330 RepID=A0A9X3SS06_9ACTN|nr:hypothetical protein [Glycomyces luteolus]MDA1360644.1 hypothetical protein [Glycomyces luteolus]